MISLSISAEALAILVTFIIITIIGVLLAVATKREGKTSGDTFRHYLDGSLIVCGVIGMIGAVCMMYPRETTVKEYTLAHNTTVTTTETTVSFITEEEDRNEKKKWKTRYKVKVEKEDSADEKSHVTLTSEKNLWTGGNYVTAISYAKGIEGFKK